MKKLLLLIVAAFLFIFVSTKCTESMPINEDKEEMTVAHPINTVDSIIMVNYDGEVFQEVYYSDGGIEVFASYLHIKDIGLRKNYMTYKSIIWSSPPDNVGIYLSDSLKLTKQEINYLKKLKESGDNTSAELDRILFNHFLKSQGKSLLTDIEYLQLIKGQKEISIFENKQMLLFLIISCSLIVLIGAWFNSRKKPNTS